jgi:hypothetical protein
MPVLIWSTLFLASGCALFVADRRPAMLLLALSLAIALAVGVLHPIALPAIAALAASLIMALRARRMFSRIAAHALFLALTVTFATHLLPGFHNTLIYDRQRLSADAIPFTMYLSLDKALPAFAIVLLCPWARKTLPWQDSRRGRLLIPALSCAGCLLLALGFGLVRWEPKWPALAAVWLLNNLLLVSLSEEAVFRVYLQGGLSRAWAARRHGASHALACSTVLFGLAHLAAGWRFALVAGLAGLGYGLAYRHGGIKAAVLVHFALNAVQFFLFTYPMLAAA